MTHLTSHCFSLCGRLCRIHCNRLPDLLCRSSSCCSLLSKGYLLKLSILLTLDLLLKLRNIDSIKLLVMCPNRLIFDLCIGQPLSEQVTFTDSHDRAVAIRATSEQHIIRAPGQVVNRRIMNVPNNRDRGLLVSRVNDDLISGGDGEDHSIRQFQKASLVSGARRLLVKVWIKLDASGVCLESWQHECGRGE